MSVKERFTLKPGDFEIVSEPIEKHGSHDQKTHGNWATGGIGSGVAQSVLDRVAENGGLSVKLVDGSEPTGGYMVAKGSQYGSVASAVDFYDPVKGPKILADYLKKHKATLGNANNYLGLWHNKDDGNVYLDVSENIQDKGRAISAGAKRDQISIWDVANFAEIPTGGTGSVEKNGSGGDSAKYLGDDGRGDRSVRSEDLGEVRQAKIIRFAPGLKPILKHLPGQHDQASHGVWASGRFANYDEVRAKMEDGTYMTQEDFKKFMNADWNSETPPEGNVEGMQKMLIDMFTTEFTGKDRETGKPVTLKTEVTYAHNYTDSRDGVDTNYIEMSGEINLKDGTTVGEFSRLIFNDANGDVQMENAMLQLYNDYTGTGFGNHFTNRAEEFAHAMGIKNQYVHAVQLDDLDNSGPFVWAKRGYGWDTSSGIKSKQNKDQVSYFLDDVLAKGKWGGKDLDPSTEATLYDLQARIQKYSPKDKEFPTPHEIAYTGWVPSALLTSQGKPTHTWVGQYIMGAANWFGVKPIGPTNERTP